jgi:hypothetical protein
MTNDELDDLVEYWHEHDTVSTLSVFLMNSTGWTRREVERWLMTGQRPKSGQ